MSSYSSLDNKPISQLKVTELKEELKRRKLTTKGLKEDLVRRLDEALRIERENAEREKQEQNGTDSGPQSVVEGDNAESVSQSVKDVDKKSDNDEKMDDVRVKIDINESFPPPDQPVQEGGHVGVGDSGKGEENVSTIIVEESTNMVAEVASSEQDQPNPEKKENGDSEIQLENEDSEHQREIDDVKPSLEDAIPDSAAPNNQVSEVSPTLGFQVKSDSISTDSLSINEKNEFKDNIIADNIKLELDVIKPEMVEPSSSNVVPVDGKSHPMDVEEPHENKVAVEDKEDEKSTKADLNKSNETADVSYSEKLNLDRSSGDDSMEEDLPESKHIELKHNEVEVRDSNEKTEVTVLKEEIPGHIVGDVEKKDDVKVENIEPTTLAEKRKLNDQGGSGSNEPIKRQRKWKAETLKVHEAQGSTLSPVTTPKEALLTPTLRRNFTRSDSTASDDTPKERVVPPSQKPPTNSLRIDRFLRPFTLKAVEELLGKTGTVKSFWMDHIKTHCYVTYSSVEEAVETRNAVYNLQWPPNGGRLLVADFVDPQEVKSRAEAPPSVPGPAAAAPPTGPAATTQPTTQPQPSPRNQAGPPKQQLPPPPLPPPPPAQERERVHLPPPPPLSDKADPTIVTLDVLFKKTKATPRIYYLPLTDEQVSAKLEGRGRPTRL